MKTETIKIINWHDKTVIFSHRCKNNSIKKAVEAALKQGIYLDFADLSGADLSGVDFSGARLYRADLRGADLSGADFTRADLFWAKLDENQKDDLSKALSISFVESEGGK